MKTNCKRCEQNGKQDVPATGVFYELCDDCFRHMAGFLDQANVHFMKGIPYEELPAELREALLDLTEWMADGMKEKIRTHLTDDGLTNFSLN